MGAEGSVPLNQIPPMSSSTVTNVGTGYPNQTTTAPPRQQAYMTRNACADDCLGEVRRFIPGAIDTMHRGTDFIRDDTCSTECIAQYGRFIDPNTGKPSAQLYAQQTQPSSNQTNTPAPGAKAVAENATQVRNMAIFFFILLIIIACMIYFGGIILRKKQQKQA